MSLTAEEKAKIVSEFGTNNFGNGPLGGRCRFGNIPRT